MPIDPEELKKRRAERDARRAARKRKLMIRIGIAAAVLLLCGILLFVLHPKEDDSPAQNADVPSTAQEDDAVPHETETSDITTVHVALAGDVNITDTVVASGGADYDYTEIFLDIAHILAEADLTAVNLEGNLCGAPYGTDSASAPQQLADALSRAGVDLVQLANSYSINQGISGLASTINSVRAAGMEPMGAYENQAAFKSGKGYTIQTVQGVKIAFVAFTKGMDGMALPPGSEDCVNLLYEDYESTYQDIDTEGIVSILEDAAKEHPDITIAMLHWGSEYNDSISSSQESLVSLFQEYGVDAIIGTHSHYVQKISFDQETGMLVAYSLGDLLGDGDKFNSRYSLILDLEITKNTRNGKAQISGYSYTPIYTVSEERSLRIVRIAEAMAAYEDSFIKKVSPTVYENMVDALSRIESRISGEG